MRFSLSRLLHTHTLTCHWLSKPKARPGMPRFNPISKYSRNRLRSLHLNIIQDDHVDVSIKAKRLQLFSFNLLCNKINITISFLQSSILTKFVYLFYAIVNISYLTTFFNESSNHCKLRMLNTYISLAVQIFFSTKCFCFLRVLLFLCVVLLRSSTNHLNYRIAYDDVPQTNHTIASICNRLRCEKACPLPWVLIR